MTPLLKRALSERLFRSLYIHSFIHSFMYTLSCLDGLFQYYLVHKTVSLKNPLFVVVPALEAGR